MRRISLVGAYLILLFIISLPQGAMAFCCVASTALGPQSGLLEETADGIKNVGACFSNTAAQAECGSITGMYLEKDNWIKIGDNLGLGRGCKCYPDKVCDPNIEKWLSCPDMKGNSLLLNQTLKALNVTPPIPNVIKFKPAVSIPGSSKFIAGNEVTIDAGTLAEYITALYTFVVGSIGLLAVIGIMIGGFQYLIAAGAPDKISQAKESITSAIIGLIIALTSFLLLRTINVNLVDFAKGVSRLTPIERKIFDQLSDQQGKDKEINACVNEEAAVAPFTAADFPNFQGKIVVASGIDARIRWQVRDLLNNAANATYSGVKFVDWLKNNGLTLQINSAFRTSEKQFELRNCYENRIKGTSICPYNCTTCNEAAQQNCNAPHQEGWALDLCLNGANAGAATCGTLSAGAKPPATETANPIIILQNYLQQTSVGFRRYCREWWHFEHPGYSEKGPVTSCRCGPGIYDCSETGPSATGDSP